MRSVRRSVREERPKNNKILAVAINFSARNTYEEVSNMNKMVIVNNKCDVVDHSFMPSCIFRLPRYN